MKGILITLLFIARIASAADVTEKTSCPALYGFTEVEPISYELSLPIDKKGLYSKEYKETKAILKDTMGPVQIFFPDLNRPEIFLSEGMENAFKKFQAELASRPLDSLAPEERRRLVRVYATSVLDYLSKNPADLRIFSKSGVFKASEKQLAATSARMAKLRSDPHQMDLLVTALDSQLSYRLQQASVADPFLYKRCREFQGLSFVLGACGVAIGHMHGEFSPLIGHGFDILSATAGLPFLGIDLFAPQGLLRTALLKRESDRALKRYLAQAVEDGRNGEAWGVWKFTSQTLNRELGSSPSLEDAVSSQGYRLLNTAGFLHAITVEELPTGESFEKIFKEGSTVPKEKLAEILKLTDQRREQLGIVRKELTLAKQLAERDVGQARQLTASGSAEASPAINQAAASQLQLCDQLAASIQIADKQLEKIRNLVAMTDADQTNHEQMEEALKEFHQALDGKGGTQ